MEEGKYVFVCAICNKPVMVVNKQLQRSCEHKGETVFANLSAKVVGEGKAE
jgi:hypothetical protein